MNTEINTAVQRTRQYWYVDGLSEMALGGICLVLALYFFASASLLAGSFLAELLNMLFLLILVGSSLLARRIVNRLKTRLTYPRTGYVAYRHATGWRRMAVAGTAVLISLSVTALLVASPVAISWMPAVTGLVFGATGLFMGYRIGLLRFYLLGLGSLLLGGAASLSGLENISALAVYYALMGLALLLSGGLTLRSYLRETSSPEEATA